MDFRSLSYFVMVAQELNFTRAAKKLNISQPPLSNQIRDMERDLGVQLFIRGKRRLQLTDAGRLLLRRALQIQELAAHAREELASMENEVSGTIRIGQVEGRAPFLVARWIAAFHEKYPLVHYAFTNGSSDDVIELLTAGSLDLGVIAAPYDTVRLDGFSVGKDPWVAVIPEDHPLASAPGDTVSLEKLADEPIIAPSRPSRQESLIRWFGTLDKEPKILCTLSSYTEAIALVEQNVGICIFPLTTYTPNSRAVVKMITGPAKYAEYLLVWNKKRPLFGLSKTFADFVREFVEQDEYHTKRFQTRTAEFKIPKNAELL